MSKIALPIAELKPALTGLSKVLNRHSALPELQSIKIERTRDGWIALTATNITTFITVRLEQPSNGDPCVLLVPYEDLHATVKVCSKDDVISVKIERDEVSIEYPLSGQTLERKCTTVPAEQFPAIPRIKGEAVPLPDSVRVSIREGLECSSEDESRLILNSTLIDVSKPKCHQIVATDGRHLYASNSFSLPMDESLVIPSHRFLEYKEFNADGEWQIKAGKDSNDDGSSPLVQISSRRWRFITRQYEGNYPNWRQVLPTNDQFQTGVTFNPSDLDKLSRVIERLPDHDPKDHGLGIDIKGTGIQLLARSKGDDPMTSITIPAVKIEGKDVRVHLNREYLCKALRFGLNRLEVIDSMSPVRISKEGRQMIVMPIRTGESPKPTEPPATETGEGEAEPVDPKPVANAATTERKEPVIKEETNIPTPAPAQGLNIDGQLDQCLDEIDALRGTVQDALSNLTSLRAKLKVMQREYKGSVKEMHAVRQTLRSLQSVKL